MSVVNNWVKWGILASIVCGVSRAAFLDLFGLQNIMTYPQRNPAYDRQVPPYDRPVPGYDRQAMDRGSNIYLNTPYNVSLIAPPPPPPPPDYNRDSRFLPLFSVVNFDIQECAASTGENGTCMTLEECRGRGGIASGPCVRTYGVCCIFVATCGQTTADNCTYFVNTGYPSAYDGTGSCQLTVHKARPDICQFRLDFEQFTIQGPEQTHHVCNSDQFLISSGGPINAICGVNTGNHMYIDAGSGASNPVTLTFVTSGPKFPRTWKVKICQIPCNSVYRAEEGCLQYYTGVSGTIKSYNYEPATGLQLSNQDYTMCIRAERNFCGIQYSACADPVNNRSHAFTLTGNTLGQNPVASQLGSTGPNSCNMDWLVIPCTSNTGRISTSQTTCVDRLCGGTLSAEISTIASTIYSNVRPFRISYHTNNVESPTDMGNRGFCLNYIQQPCTSIYS
nr:PREDICTED: uncharacterized protein LOC109034848 [Bemisia tabaci]